MASTSAMDVDLTRSGSVSLLGSIGKRKRTGDEEEQEIEHAEEEEAIVEEVIDLVMNDSNKISKGVGRLLIKKVQKLAAIVGRRNYEIAHL